MTMFVAVAKVRIIMQQNDSLKDKRRVLSSMTQRLRAKFNVAVAEVELQDVWRQAVLGIVTVSSSPSFVRESLDTVVRFIEGNFPVEVAAVTIDVF
ncbi:MAG TPA: DUF503 domain-containing protein [Firmicutes bacterium]|nr:DUF503 domain-containing protein [Bacillota bacterium]